MQSTMETKKVSNPAQETNKHEEWFSSFINDVNEKIKKDKSNLETGTASKETMDFYNSLIAGDNIKAMGLSRNAVSSILIKEIIINYLKLLREIKTSLTKLAFDISANKVLVWTEISENDEKSEMELIKIESKINAKFSDITGIDLDSIIVEDCDKLPIPSHYQSVGIS